MSDLSSQIREICRLMEIKPARSKGQNFLVNAKIYEDIVRAANLQATDTVLEVGPGLGFLTVKLAQAAGEVIAVELDDKLANYLKMGVDSRDITNVKVINEDILRFSPGDYFPAGKKYKIVANLPYNITSIFLRRFLSREPRPSSLVLMLQKEVAERIVAQAPEMSLLAVSVQYYAAAEIVRTVKAGNFWPEPEVDSAIIKLTAHDQTYSAATDKRFFQMVKIGFSAKRKMLKNNLAAGLKIEPSEIEKMLIAERLNPRARAEDLSLEDWQKLFATLTPFMV